MTVLFLVFVKLIVLCILVLTIVGLSYGGGKRGLTDARDGKDRALGNADYVDHDHSEFA